jgi:hypothetical protein
MGMRPDSHDWARLAAYIDGEGSINLSPRATNTGRTQTFCAKVVVTNTDFRLAEWCQRTFQMKFYGHSNNSERRHSPNWKSCYYAQACGYKAAWILLNCLPWFVLKREQAEVVLQHQETLNPDMFERGSGMKTPQHVLDIRIGFKKRLAELNKRGPRVEENPTSEAM